MATNQRPLSRLCLVVAAQLLLVTCSSQQDSTNEPDFLNQFTALFNSNHFQLSAKACIIGKESINFNHEVTVAEFYSNQLGQSRLEIRAQISNEDELSKSEGKNLLKDGNPKTYHFSEKVGKFLLTTQTQRTCELAERIALVEELIGSKVNLESPELGMLLTLISPDIPKYVSGFARLLYLVVMNRAKLQLRNQSRNVLVRNQEVEDWDLELPVSSSSTEGNGDKKLLKLKLYAPKTVSQQQLGIPLRIWIRAPDNAELFVDYSSVGPLLDVPSRKLAHEDSILDFFSYPTGRGCSRTIRAPNDPLRMPSKQESHMKDLQERRIASFEAEFTDSEFFQRAGAANRLFVAYDGFAQSLRLDRMHRTFESYTITIDDMLFRQRYHIKQPMASTKTIEPASRESELRLVDMASGQQECYATRSSGESLEPLFRFTEFVRMGNALVRGIKTVAFEEVSKELPRLICPRVSYTDSTGARRVAFEPAQSEFIENGNPREYSIVYFFSTLRSADHDFEPLDQLLRIDVFHKGNLLYRVEVLNFRWTLAEAPNGDRQDLLFSLQDRCRHLTQRLIGSASSSGPSTGERAASLLLLELSYKQTPTLWNAPAARILKMIQSPTIRNRAVIRGLTSTSNSIFASQILSIKSRVHDDRTGRDANETKASEAIKILASLELAHSGGPGQAQFEAIIVARGRRKSLPRVVEAIGAEECFWNAAQELTKARLVPNLGADAEREPVILFSICQWSCIIDDSATRTRSNGTYKYKSNSFYISDESKSEPCEILQMRTESAPKEEKVMSWFDVYSTLNEKLLSLRVNDHQEDNVAVINELLFKVTRIELNSLSGESSALLEDSLYTNEESSLLNGLALVPNEQLGIEALDLGLESGSDFEVPPAMSADACHAECVVDLKCKSYSTCVIDSQLQCVVSQLDLHGVQLTKSLDASVREFRASHQGKLARGTIRIDSRLLAENQLQKGTAENGADAGSADQSPKATEIEFRVDNRCRTRAKRATELFKHQAVRSSPALLESALVGVQDVDECARLCLKRNVVFFKRLTRIKVELKAGEWKPTEIQADLLESMRYWCSNFRYADLQTRSVPYDILSLVRKISKLSSAPALCYMSMPRWAPQISAPNKKGTGPKEGDSKKESDGVAPKKADGNTKLIKIQMDNFEFQYASLYKRHADLHLLASGKKSLDILALTQPATEDAQTQEVSQESKVSNRQTIEEQTEVEICARRCFSQVLQWCRSFDLVELIRSAEKRTFCVYNSLTLGDARQLDPGLVSSSINERRQLAGTNVTSILAWHFEPQRAYQIDNVVFKFLDKQNTRSNDLVRKEPLTRSWTYFPTTALLICSAGVASGLLFAQYFSRRRDQAKQQSQRLERAQTSLDLAPDVQLVQHDHLELEHL